MADPASEAGRATGDFLSGLIYGRELKRRRKKEGEKEGLEALQNKVAAEDAAQSLSYFENLKKFQEPYAEEPVPISNIIGVPDVPGIARAGMGAYQRREEAANQLLLNRKTTEGERGRIRAITGRLTPKEEAEKREAKQREVDMVVLEKIRRGLQAGADWRAARDTSMNIATPSVLEVARKIIDDYTPPEAKTKPEKPAKPGNYERAVESLQQQGNENPSVGEIADEMKRLFGKGEKEEGFDLHELSGALQLRGTEEQPGPYAGASLKDIISASKTGAARIRKQGTPSSRVGELRKAESAPAEPQKSTRESVLALDPTAFPNFDIARQFYKSAWDEGKITQEEYQKFYGFIKGHYKKP